MDFMFGFGANIISIIFPLMFLLILGFFVVTIVQSIRQWNRNNHSPRLNVTATVVDKRTNVSHHHGAGDTHHHHTSTSYYVTFEVESGDRMEFHVAGEEYGMLIVGDNGTLLFQGTRYLGFERF